MSENAMVSASYGATTKDLAPGTTVKQAATRLGVKSGWFSKPNVHVNGAPETNWNRPLKSGDRVEFTKAQGRKG